MEKTTRRHLLKAAAVGGVTAAGLGSMVGGPSSAASADSPARGDEHAHDNRPNSGKRAHAVVAFGQWDVDPADTRGPLDRGLPPPPPPNRNVHMHLPFEAEVDAGGAVSFIISGLHQVVIYANRELADVQAAAAPSTDLPGIPLLGGRRHRRRQWCCRGWSTWQPIASIVASTRASCITCRLDPAEC